VAGPGGVQSYLLSLKALPDQGSSLKAGQVAQAVIQENQGELVAIFDRIRIPVPPSASLAKGQNVTVEVVRGDAGLQFRVSAAPQQGVPSQTSATPAQPAGQGTVPAPPLSPGQVLQATVQGSGSDLAAVIGGTRVPLPPGAQLPPGQPVTVQIIQSDAGLLIRVTPNPTAVEGAALAPGQTVHAVVQGTPGALVAAVQDTAIPLPATTQIAPGQTVTLEIVPSESGPLFRLVPNAQSQAQPAAPPLSLQGTLQGKPGDLSAVVGNTRIPLGALPELQAGQTVTVEIAQGLSELLFRVVEAQPQAAPATAATPLPGLITSVLKALGAFRATPTAPQSAAQIVPPNFPSSDAAVRNLLSMFLADGQTSQDLQLLQSLVSEGAASGGIPQALADEFTALVTQFMVAEDGDIAEVLQQWGRGSGRSLEARLAQALATGDLNEFLDQAEGDLRSSLARFRQEGDIVRYLQGKNQLRSFQGAVDRVLNRLTGAQLQNMRGVDLPYAFLELPAMDSTGIQRAQIHIFGEGRGERRFDPRNATVAMDLSLTRLGDIWVSLTVVKGHCACRFRATRPEVVEAIEAEADALRGALTEAGYAGVQVQAGLWSGQRLDDVAGLMRRFSGLNVKA
jgi:flagellar hook-length control protein FliK